MELTTFYRYLSLNIWGNLPSGIQRKVSKFYASIYNRPFTRFIIKPYCKLNYSDPDYLNKFRSESGNEGYSSFQDFFTRVYKNPPIVEYNYAWPCEGLLCDYGEVGELPDIHVKCDLRSIRTVFGKFGNEIKDEHFFSNIFLHNNNYHRIHSPVKSIVKDVEHIPGDLVLLRPWVYKNDPSLPAMRNERVNIKLEDDLGRYWYVSIVGGPAVGTIVINNDIAPGQKIDVTHELGKFLLGSTCCMVSPEPTHNVIGETVYMGNRY